MPSSPSTPPATVTQKDIAKALGLSQSAVSKALKNMPEIEEGTRKLVQKTAQKMGYQPNAMGAGLAQFKRSSTIKPVHAALAWLNLWPKPRQLRSYTQFESYWQGALMTAEKFGYRLEEFIVNDAMPPARLEKILLTRGIRGLLMPPVPHTADVDWSGFDWNEFSCVRFSRAMRGLPHFHVVTSAQSANASLALRSIRERGYKRIGYAGYKTGRSTYLGGFLQQQSVSIPTADRVPPMLLDEEVTDAELQNKLSGKKHAERFAKWLDQWKVDAIVTEVSSIATLLEFAGRRVPQDVAVAGLNVSDLPFDAGIYQNPQEIGRVATLVAISLLHDNDRGIPAIAREILVQGEWIDGKSAPSRSRPHA